MGGKARKVLSQLALPLPQAPVYGVGKRELRAVWDRF